jgi:hypothetical protein
MTRFIAVLALSGLASAVHAEPAPTDGVTMVLLYPTSQLAEGSLVRLMEVSGQQCEYAGQLIPGSAVEKQLGKRPAPVGGVGYDWAISINRQTCPDGVTRVVRLVAPLKVAADKDDYTAGAKVLAFPVGS